MKLRKILTEEKVFLSVHGLLFIWNIFLSIPVFPLLIKQNNGKILTQLTITVIILLILMLTYQSTGYIHSRATGILTTMLIGNILFLIFPFHVVMIMISITFIFVSIAQGRYITKYLQYGTTDNLEIEKRIEARISEEEKQMLDDEINRELYGD